MKIDLRDLQAVQLLGNYADAERCLGVYSTPWARSRPAAAWELLPLGLGVREAAKLLAEVPEEHDVEPELHAHHFALLQLRRDCALAAWTAYIKPETTHVH